MGAESSAGKSQRRTRQTATRARIMARCSEAVEVGVVGEGLGHERLGGQGQLPRRRRLTALLLQPRLSPAGQLVGRQELGVAGGDLYLPRPLFLSPFPFPIPRKWTRPLFPFHLGIRTSRH